MVVVSSSVEETVDRTDYSSGNSRVQGLTVMLHLRSWMDT